jgi:hypothetical protein
VKYTYRVFKVEHLGFFIEEMIGTVATCDHSITELKNFHSFPYEENELTEHAQSSIRTYNYVIQNHPELFI